MAMVQGAAVCKAYKNIIMCCTGHQELQVCLALSAQIAIAPQHRTWVWLATLGG